MCRFSDVLLNCVNIYTRRSSELRQLLIGISTNRYFPARGTAGFARSLVNGNRRVPAPPPMMMASVSFWKDLLSIVYGRVLETQFSVLPILQAGNFFVTMVFAYVRDNRLYRQFG